MDKYSSDVQKIITFAESVAFKFSHSLIGSEHLLLGILKTENTFSKELKNYKVTYDSVSKKVKELYPRHDNSPLYMEYTIELKSILDTAGSISRQYHENQISINSLAVSMMISENTMAYDLLKKMKVDIRSVNQKIQSKMQKKSDLVSISDLHDLSEISKDPLIGRENELEQLICALSRRNKPNAILVGEPGVGKTAIVEELAKLLKENKIPSLKDKTIYELDLAATVGGTKYRGEFEEKIKKILKKVIDDGNCILFIDEIHNVIKAGGAEGAIDASNIIKPYLSRGQIQIIGATTEDEFQSIFEKDKALKRRFQVVKISPNTPKETLEILKRIKGIYEKYYHLIIEDEILEYIVSLGERVLINYYFPDKAIDILDNACVISKVKLTKENVEKTIESYYKIRVNSLNKKEVALNKIQENIFGQEHVLEQIRSHLSLIDNDIYEKDKPVLSLMFLGPSGVGKSKTAQIIGETYCGSENVIYLDMSNYQEINSINKLIGSSYNSDNIPKLVRELKSKPKSLILLDEIEKANNEVLDLFLSIMDRGFFDSAKGERIDCRSAMIIMTSNFGYDTNLSFKNRLNSIIDEKEYVISHLQKRFRYEFLSRLDDIIIFSYLNDDAKKVIAQKYLESFNLNMEISSLDDLFIQKEEDYQKYGARIIKKDVKAAVLKEIEKIKIK